MVIPTICCFGAPSPGLLLSSRADPTQRMTDCRHATALDLASRNEHVEVVRLLEMKDATKLARTTRLWAPWMVGDLMAYMVKRGSNYGVQGVLFSWFMDVGGSYNIL